MKKIQISRISLVVTLIALATLTTACPPHTPPPTPSPPPYPLVDAQRAWVLLCEVESGDLVEIHVTGEGSWSINEEGYASTDGAGLPGVYRESAPLPSAPLGALIGRIGEGEPFLIGNQLTFEAPQTGTLAAQINDTWLGDNLGALSVEIKINQPAEEGDNLIANGDFFQGLELWEVQANERCTQCQMKAGPGDDPQHPFILHWERRGSANDWAAIRAYQRLGLDLRACTSLVLTLDVRLDYYNLPDSGQAYHAPHGEYPAKITLKLTGLDGERIEWAHGFLHEPDEESSLVNYSLVPAGQWTAFRMDILAPGQWVDERGVPLPPPAILNELNISGSGWDFAAAVTNLRLTGCEPSQGERIFHLQVNARDEWGVQSPVFQGDKVTIEYMEGTWGVWGGSGSVQNRTDANGYDGEYRENVPMPSAPVGALIGRINQGEPFFVGNRAEFIVPEDGVLWLGVNDLWRDDNTGGLVVRVTIWGTHAHLLLESDNLPLEETETTEPLPEATPAPLLSDAITAENVAQVVRQGQLGLGSLQDVVYSPEGAFLVAGTPWASTCSSPRG